MQTIEKDRVVVGSSDVDSHLKCVAIRWAYKLLGNKNEPIVAPCTTNKAMASQRSGMGSTQLQAFTYAKSAKQLGDDIIGVGIETGIFFQEFRLPFIMDVVVVIGEGNKQICCSSSLIEIPEEYRKMITPERLTIHTVGAILARAPQDDPADPYSIITNGKVSREHLLINTLVTAFKQL